MDNNPNPVVNPQPTTENLSEQVKTQPNLAGTGVPPVAAQPGDKTESALLLESLQAEREKRRLAEERAKLLEEQIINNPTPSGEIEESEEGKRLKKLIEDQDAKIAKLEDEKALEKVYAHFPELSGLSSEFEAYRADYPRHKLENVAKLFLVEKGLKGDAPRPGLEKSTGGERVTPSTGMSVEDVRILRTTNFKKYQEMLSKGLIKIE